MHVISQTRSKLTALAALIAAGLVAQPGWGYPPAPPHTIYGMARGEDGAPFTQSSVQLVLETDAGVRVTTQIVPNLEPGVNYRLIIPMDANITPDPYLPNALVPLVPFRIYVVIGGVTNLPVEMAADFENLGDYGESTRIDLTLGVDSDGDGLPDAWEQIVIDMLGGGLTLNDITAGGDADGDGMTNLEEYIAGTYAFDPGDGLRLQVVGAMSEYHQLRLTAIRGRSYRIERSVDLESWEPVPFRVPTEGYDLLNSYPANDTRSLTLDVPHSSGPEAVYYRAIVQ